MSRVQKLGFYATPPHACTYLPDREAITLFADPHFPKNARLYAALADCGFRRSGEHLYIPHCTVCSSCTPVRIPVHEFSLSSSQRRTWKRNQDLIITPMAAEYHEEHFLLYQRYLKSRHAGGGMDEPTPDSYIAFLSSSWSETIFYEMRDQNAELIALAVADLIENALSAVYTFYAPEQGQRSPGRYAILYAIKQAKIMGRQWLYLGYWINECKKMSYKTEYQPMEYYRDKQWIRGL